MKKILVIGGTGFIGFHVIKKAKKLNWKVTSISKKKPKIKRKHTNVNYKFADIENFQSLKKNIFQIAQFQKVITISYCKFKGNSSKIDVFSSHRKEFVLKLF